MIYNAYQDTDTGIGGVSVLSCGHIFAKTGRKIDRPAGRPDYLLFYVAKGCEQFHLDSDVTAPAGSFVFFRPHEPQQHVYTDSKPGEFYYIHFNAPEGFDLFGFKSSFVYNCAPSTTLCAIFEEIISELQKKQPAYEMYCASMLFTLFSMLTRNTKKELSEYSVYFDKISFVIQQMNKEYQINYSLEDYAKMCNLSKYHFLRIFEDITGVSPIEYRNTIRFDHIKEQLKDSSAPISEIAEKAGFTSHSYFCSAFKKKFGMSPGEYKKSEQI
ncbi:MAG: helix-turn-helix transcriptional regulator [Clostridia bacterium]|nr:helix-turn-helix transcriptional regulator [Clostridia bacterium]